jgi:thiamine-monophosphate kinase
LTGGEDYEILFTAPPLKHKYINSISSSLNIPITMIGEIRENIEFLENGKRIDIIHRGYNHFKE